MNRPDETEDLEKQTPLDDGTSDSSSPGGDESDTTIDEDRTSAMKTRRQLALGGFPIEQKIGEGGMGIVYRAFDPDLHRTVAIKKIHPRLAGDRDYAQRFTNEARAVAAVSHANIAGIFSIHARDLDTPPFFVMEYVDGPSVESLVRTGGPLDPARAVEISLQAARGLRAAHGRGLIHSDIKPSNILTTRRGDVKLVDFGLAQRMDERGADGGTETVFGTPHYIAPEQARGWIVDHRADMYSLGCTLFYMLTGEELFPGKNRVELVTAHCTEGPPRVSERRSMLPPGLDAVLARMLAKNPDERHQTYDDLIHDLRDLLRLLEPRKKSKAPSTTIPLIALVLIVFSGAAWIIARGRTEPPLDLSKYFGLPYTSADGDRGESLHLDFGDVSPYDDSRRQRYWTFPGDVGEHEFCRVPWLSDNTLKWANFPERVILPPFLDLDEIELSRLLFFGRPHFEITLGFDPDRPGNELRIFFAVGEKNEYLLECRQGGERVEIDEGHLDFTVDDNAEYSLRLSRTMRGENRYSLVLTRHNLENDSDQERVKMEFSIPAEVRLRGSVAMRAATHKNDSWAVSVEAILLRGTVDRERIQREML